LDAERNSHVKTKDCHSDREDQIRQLSNQIQKLMKDQSDE